MKQITAAAATHQISEPSEKDVAAVQRTSA